MRPEEQDDIDTGISERTRRPEIRQDIRPETRQRGRGQGILTVVIATVGSILAVTAIIICIVIFLYVRGSLGPTGGAADAEPEQVHNDDRPVGEKIEVTREEIDEPEEEETSAKPITPVRENADTGGLHFTEEQLNELLEEEATSSFAAGLEQGRAEERETLLSAIKAHMSEPDPSTGELLRELYPDDTIVYRNKTYHFIPVDKSLPQNTLSDDAFVQNPDGTMDYSDENRKKPVKGIDVSAYQGDIDWNTVAASGVEFVIMRIGIRGYTVGGITLDEKFPDNIQGATAAGLHVGVYFFSQAKDRAEILEEINFIFENLGTYRIDGPIVIDVEDVAGGQGRTGQLTVEQRTELVKYFCEEVESRGYLPMIYGNLNSMMMMLDITKLGKYEKWYAYYSFPIYFKYEYAILQYGDKGKVPGIPANVDMNLAFKTWW